MPDVIAAHAARLPALDGRWTPRPVGREELASGLLAGGVAGTATHPLDNVRGNALLLNDGDFIVLAALDPAYPRPEAPGVAAFTFRSDCP